MNNFDENDKRIQRERADQEQEEPTNLPPSHGTPVEVVRLPSKDEPNSREPIAVKGSVRPEMTTQSAGAGMATAKDPEAGQLFSSEEAGKLRGQWDSIQVGFVDEPRRSIEAADSLVSAAMKRLAEQFSEERSRLEGQWNRGGDVSTEDLRLALRRYRSFFGRLLAV